MLKIKEDKIQELEKFGFKKCKATGGVVYFYDIYKNEEKKYHLLHYYSSYIDVEVMQDRTITLDVNCDDVRIDELDIFWKLFANDMVEKVGE